jgi:hypothetical protein
VPETVVEATVETVDGERAAAKSGSRQSGRTETTAANPGRTETAAADRGRPEAAAHSHPATAEATTAHSHPAAAEAAAATTVEAATATAKTTTRQSRVRRQHGHRCACEQGDHHFA